MNRVSKVDEAAADWIVRRDNGLTPAETILFNRWLEDDPSHAAALARQDETWTGLERPRRNGQADDFLRQLSSRAARRRNVRIRVAGVAVLVLFVAGLMWRGQIAQLGRSPAGSLVAKASVILPETRTLPDGSIIELNDEAEIAMEFSAVFRRVRLRTGRAHFQVAKDENRPFIVEAAGVEVRAVGTAFTVEFGAKRVDVLVTEGRVTVEPPAPAGNFAPTGESAVQTTVDAGNRVAVDLAEKAPLTLEPVTKAEIAERMAWRAPRLDFTDTPLADAVALLNQHSGGRWRFQVDDSRLAGVHVSGYFRADNADTFVRLLEASFGVRAERAGYVIILRKAE